MISFLIVTSIMVLVAFAFILPPLLGRSRPSGVVRNELNISIFKERLQELERDLENELLSSEQFDAAKSELERGLLQDVDEADAGTSAPIQKKQSPWGALITLILVPVVAAGFYMKLGSTDMLDGSARAPVNLQEEVNQQHQVEDMIAGLETKLQQNPNDSKGWYMLARTYSALDRYADAVGAFERAYAITGDDAEILVNYAEALAMVDKGNFTGRSAKMVERALELNPKHDKGLWIAGFAAFQQQKYQNAIAHWQKLAPRFPPESREGQMLAEYMGQARDALGQVSQAVQPQPKPEPQPEPQLAGNGLAVKVSLSGELSSKADAEDVVFIFARATKGPRMPLAIVKKRVKDLPIEVLLDDSMAMIPDMKISNFEELVVGARISKSGNAQPQSGDLQGAVRSGNSSAETIDLVIDQEVL